MSGATGIAFEGLSAILLDMGGVLVDLGEGHGLPTGDAEREGREALARCLREHGGQIPSSSNAGGTWDGLLDELLFDPWRRGYRRRSERGAEEPWEPHLARLRAATGAQAADEALLSAWFEPFGRSVPAVPGAADALTRLQDLGLSLGLVSNVPLPGFLYRRILERHRLLAPLSCLRFSHDAGVRKPRPGMLLQVLEELSVPAAEALMVGDRRDSDVAAGRAAAVRTVRLTGGRHGSADDGPDPDLTLGSLAELPAALAATIRDSPREVGP